MKLANKVYVGTLMMLMLVFTVVGQGLSDKDPRNTAPTVGTGGPAGGPTGLFTVYDGKTLRKGEFTFSAAYSNYDRDPGDVDITSVPLSFQIGVTNRLELYFGTEAWRGIKVNSPANLSGFYLPNSTLVFNGVRTSAPAIVLAPGTSGAMSNRAVFRPVNAPNCAFPYTGCSAGNYGLFAPSFSGNANYFGNNVGGSALLGPPRAGGAADLFPGVGSAVGGILPGIVLSTTNVLNAAGAVIDVRPLAFTIAPSYLEDAPFVNRTWGTSTWNSMDFGAKWRFNNSTDAVGYGVVANWRRYWDTANSAAGFNQMNRGSGPGAKWGDFSLTAFVDGRLSKHVNLSANAGYTYTTNPQGNFGGTKYTLLDRADQLALAIGVDFPVNEHFQPILEFRSLHYVGGHTPNALENDPYDGLAGFRVFPRRWWGFGAWYRHHFNQQDAGSFNSPSTASVIVNCNTTLTAACAPTVQTTTFTGLPTGFRESSDPHGFGFQVFAGRRLPRAGDIPNKPANVEALTLSTDRITIGCPPGQVSDSGCTDSRTISVTTRAVDPENDVLTYNYTVSGGRIVGQGANVSWDLSGAHTGTYTVTSAVDDGCGVCGATKTQTVTVAQCADCRPPKPTCACPSLSVSGPSGIVSPGSPMTFTATSSGDVTYNWSVSNGTISSGQGTSSITVDTTGLAGQNVTATVNIGGSAIDPTCGCPTSASETSSVQARPTANLIDEYGKLSNDDVKARMDGFYTQLNNDPTAHGYIIISGTPAQIRAARTQITKAIAFRKYDPSRVTIVEGPPAGDEVHVKLYLVPAGAENPPQ